MTLRLATARLLRSRKFFCDKLWAALSIRWNGDLEPCACACGDTPVFNITAVPFLEAWNSEPYRKTRAFLLAGMGHENLEPVEIADVFDICRNCPVPLIDRYSIIRWRLKGLDFALRARTAAARAAADKEMLRKKTDNYTRLIRYLKRPAPTVPHYPILGNIDATNLCNLRCPICKVGTRELDHPRGAMSLDTFEHLMEQIGPGLIHLELYRYGEPLLNPRTPEMIRIAARKYHCLTRISSNLSLPISDAVLDDLLDAGLDTFVAAVDGPNQETYEQYRRGGNLEQVLDNLERMIARRQARGARKPRIFWQYLVFAHNENRVQEARRIARRIGVDRFIPIEPSIPQTDTAAGWISKKHGARGFTDEPRKQQVLAARLETPIQTQHLPASSRSPVACFLPGAPIRLVARIRNTTREIWPADHGEEGSIRLGLKLYAARENRFLHECGRGCLDAPLPPENEREIRVDLHAPQELGAYRLKLDMVIEGETWHEWKTGSKSRPFWMEFAIRAE